MVAAAVGSLFPTIFNLAANAIISSNATCGENGPESYCKLVEHVFMRSPQCDICDNTPGKRHPIEFAVDGSNQWWQSPTLAHGMKYEWVTITIDLRQQYQVAYVIIKAAIAPRPGNWILERSLDGVRFKPWQFYAISDEECERVYGMKAAVGYSVKKYTSDDQVTCTSYYSRLDPFIDGEIHTSLVNGRPGIDGPSIELQEFTKARFVRLRFQKIRTLNSDLIFITRRKQHFVIDESVTRRYFYAIRDISIGGQCICYGHAEDCPPDPATQQLRCECKHNTCGESCNKCCPLFNQRPWRSGTNLQHHACEPCQCFNHSDQCVYDAEIEKQRMSVTPDGVYEGGGVCQDCKHFTTGINCQECLDEYYRPSGISPYTAHGCRPCDCDRMGSLDKICIKDDARITGNLKPGDCRCRHGFGGQRCDRCAVGFRNYPTCDPCPCNRAGSANFATCDNRCLCKANVEGEFCEKCKPGHFNLDENNPDGCTKCFCFGLSDQCTELGWGRHQIRDLIGWTLVESDFASEIPYNANNTGLALTLNNRLVNRQVVYYWKAPKTFLGSKLSSYGGLISYFVYYVVEGHRSSPYSLPDIVMKNDDTTIEFQSRRFLNERENSTMQIRLDESAGQWYDRKTGQQASKQQIMAVLTNVQLMAIRATYNQGQIQSSIYGLSMDSALPDSKSEDVVNSCEKCSCPSLYTGLSCETCITGYRRVNNQLFRGKCEACSCHGHATQCDPHNATCVNCIHNTTGAHCELCQTGYYGNPRYGSLEGACRRCACPLLDAPNNFSPTCALTSSMGANSPSDYICTACPMGYMGDKCEWCTDGFFGQPTTPANYCQPCQCNGNIDPAAIGNCDGKTGRCLKCINNTAGWSCAECKADHFGRALQHDCRACNCNRFGSISSQCDLETGRCQCKEHYIGEKCDRCEDGYGGVEKGCKHCECDPVGSFTTLCDQVSGQCQCKPGVFGKKCDSCKSGYYGFADNGCDSCNCNAHGSEEDGKCDTRTGKCFCRKHVTGSKCNLCKDGYFNISSGLGCQPCHCHSFAAESESCDPLTGQCRCKQAVVGLNCDKCKPNFYGLSANGCKQCPACPAPGHVCDPNTGECVCPPHTAGQMCETCAPNSWNHDPYKGCELCDCDSVGSTGSTCDRKSGACKCRPGYTGKKCDECMHGHYQFPACPSCDCHSPGSSDLACSAEGQCSCGDHGQCHCKKNVVGLKCTECNATAFSLEADNPKGCTECFCFNRTKFCLQSSLIWRQNTGDRRTAFFNRPWLYSEKRYGLHVLPAEPTTFNAEPVSITSPLYWSLPTQFLGDKVTSYNGFLRFRLSNVNGNYLQGASKPDNRFFDRYPLVVLVGNHRIILEHYKSAKDIAEDGVYIVKLREDMWKNRHQSQKYVDRQSLMIALQNLQAIFVRGTFIDQISEASISDASMDFAVAENSSASHSTMAVGVEACDCPSGYAGSSCQNPAEGYCRKKIDDYLDSENDLDLVGVAEPCSCHSHSNICDRETCRCLDCKDNTTGDFCEHCAPGFYGYAMRGTKHDCKKCACPSEERSFSATCFATTHNQYGFVCDKCQPGHEGARCERCQTGYFGAPLKGEPCQPCGCNAYGSVSASCDTTTGQCTCRSGVTGRDCSECRPRFTLVGSDCQSCDVGCTRELMEDVDTLESVMGRFNLSGMVPAPWGHLSQIDNRTAVLRGRLSVLLPADSDANQSEETSDKLAKTKKRLKEAHKSFDEAKYLIEKAEKIRNATEKLSEAAYELTTGTNEIWTKIHKSFAFFQRYKHGDMVHQANLSNQLISEAGDILENIKNYTSYFDQQYNLAIQSKKVSEEVFQQIEQAIYDPKKAKNVAENLTIFLGSIERTKKLLLDQVRQNATYAESLLKITGKMMIEFERITRFIDDSTETSNENLIQANKKLDETKQSMFDIYDLFTESNETLLEQVQNVTNQCDMIGNQFSQFLPQYSQLYLHTSQRHAENLTRAADLIDSIFAPTKTSAESPLNASLSYTNIKNAIANAQTEAENSLKSAESVEKQITGDKTDLISQAENAVNESLLLKEAAVGLISRDLADDLADFNSRMTNTQDKSLGVRKSAANLMTKSEKFDATSDKIDEIFKQCLDEKSQLEAQKETIDRLYQDVMTLKNKTSNLQPRESTDLQPGGQKANLKALIDDVNIKTEEMHSIKARLPEFDGRIDDLIRNIHLLKNSIKQAREKASKVKISVKSDGTDRCYRSFLSPAQPSPLSIFHVEYQPTDDVADSLIFVTTTNQTRTRSSEFMALELREKRFVFVWNIDQDKKDYWQVTSPQRVDPVPKDSNDKWWYHIDIERHANWVNLTVGVPRHGVKENTVVRKFDSQMGGLSDDGLEEGPHIFFTVAGQTRILMGLLPGEQFAPNGVQSQAFRGTLGNLQMDGQEVPLWNFVSEAGTCVASGSSNGKVYDQYTFAYGFANISRKATGYDGNRTEIEVKFATYSENGLIYFRGHPVNKDFISIELEEGRVKVWVNLGGKSRSLIYTNDSYNDGKKHSVKLLRSHREVDLIVQSDHGSIEQKHVTIPDVNFGLEANTNHFIGGVPEQFSKAVWKSFRIEWTGFYGCIFEPLVVDHHNFMIDQSESLNVRPGCRTSPSTGALISSDNIASFDGDGWMAVNGFQLDGNHSSFSFNFRTKSPNALLIYQSSAITTRKRRGVPPQIPGYISAYLVDCRLSVVIAADERTGQDQQGNQIDVHLDYQSQARPPCDGRVHTAFVTRVRNRFKLFFDDQFVAEESLSLSDFYESDFLPKIGSWEWSQLFLGGLGDRLPPENDYLEISTPLVGCISNFIVDFKPLSLAPQRMERVTLGTCKAVGDEMANDPQNDEAFDVYVPESYAEQHLAAPSLSESNTMMRDAIPIGSDEVVSKERINEQFVKVLEAESCQEPKPLKGAACYGTSADNRDSYSIIKAGISFETFEMSLKFRTSEKSNGTIFAWPSNNHNHYVALVLSDNGEKLKLVVRLHRMHRAKVLYIHQNGAKLNDNNWHSVSIRKSPRYLKIRLDRFADVKYNLRPNAKALLKRMSVGGVRKFSATRLDIPSNFHGCIKQLTLAQGIDLLDQQSIGQVQQCYENADETYHFKHDSLMIIDELKSIDNISFSFRPSNVKNGRRVSFVSMKQHQNDEPLSILSIDHNVDKNRFEIVSNKEKHIFNIKCQFTWHHLNIELGNAQISIHLDQKKIVLDEIRIPGKQILIGGGSKGHGFEGCVKHFKINDEKTKKDSLKFENVSFNYNMCQ